MVSRRKTFLDNTSTSHRRKELIRLSSEIPTWGLDAYPSFLRTAVQTLIYYVLFIRPSLRAGKYIQPCAQNAKIQKIFLKST